MPDNEARAFALRQRTFTGDIASDWKISSFSSLTANLTTVMDSSQTLRDSVMDRDGIPAAVQPMSAEQTDHDDTTLDIFSFPHGARPGTFLHELLEQAVFSTKPPLAESLVYQKLRYFGYNAAWYPAIAQMLENLGNVLLHNDNPGLKLCNIPPANCLHELEFYFPLSRLTTAGVKRIFSTTNLHASAVEVAALMAGQLDRLTFAPSRGFMRGFIDLVFEFAGKFYLVDWKSNYLGSGIESYCQDKLAGAIHSGFYFLQYHIYSLALHLYLQKRLPAYRYESHFGGVFYIFLRGVDQNLGPGSGIYHDLPDPAIIEMLKAKFIPGEKN